MSGVHDDLATLREARATTEMVGDMIALQQALERLREMLYDTTITYSTFCGKCGPMDADGNYLGSPMMTETFPLREVVEKALAGPDTGRARGRVVTGSRLAALLEQATPGPWHANTGGSFYVAELRAPSPHNGFALIKVMTNADADLALIALAPDMARLLVDMADALNLVLRDEPGDWDSFLDGDPTALLARFAEIERRAAR